MVENHADVAYDLMEVEAELCRLPDVSGVRIVADDLGRPIEVHVLAHTGKQPKQIVRDIQSVALASFGLELDRRIVSVVQLGPNGSVQTASPEQMLERTQIVSVQTNVEGRRTAVQVVLRAGEREATGFAEGSTSTALRPRIVAKATLDALAQLFDSAQSLEMEAAEVIHVHRHDIVIAALVAVNPPYEHLLCGSAIVESVVDDATIRAVLDATNRWLAPSTRDSDAR